MYNKHNLGKLKERIFITRALKGSIAALGVFVLAFTIIPVLIAEASAANSANLSVTWDTVTMVLDPDADAQTAIDAQGHGDIVFGGSSGITPVENNIADHGQSYGRLVVTKKRIGVATSGTFFSVYLSMDNNNSNSLIMANTNLELEAVHGTWDEPKTFTQNGGSGWGFAVPNTPIATSQDSWDDPEVAEFPDFSPSAASDAQLDTQISYNTDGATTLYANSVWTAVPTLNTPQQIWKESNETHDGYGFGTYTVNVQGVPTEIHSPHSDANDARYKSFDIYYAVAVDTNIVAGTYSNNIVYTGIAAASSLDEVSTNLVRDIEFGGENDVQTLRFDLNDSAASVTTNILTVALVPHSVFVGNNYTVEGLSLSDYDTCDITNFTRNTLEGYSEITCTMPMETPETGYGDGTYDYWINVDGYNYNYVSKISYTDPNTDQTSNVGAFVYAGLQTEYATSDGRYASGKKVVTEMQEMTPGICDLTNMWKNTTSVDARIMDYNGLVELASTGEASMALNLGTFALKDNRDQKDYLIRRLADGNCWMVQNLELELSDFAGKDDTNGGLTRINTDINTPNKSYWDPSESVISSMEDGENLADYLLRRIGHSDQQYQFQPREIINYSWLSRLKENGDPVASSQQYNTRSDFPRTYNPNETDSAISYIPTNWITGESQVMNNNTVIYYTGERIPLVKASAATSGNNYSTLANDNFYGTQYRGIYYNYSAATAESGTVSNTENTDPAIDSICPYGWQLPISTKSTWNNMISRYTDTENSPIMAIGMLPISMNKSGYYGWSGSYIAFLGSKIFYMTASGYNAQASFVLQNDNDNDGGIAFNGTSSKGSGYSVRCVNKGSVREPVVATCDADHICYNGNGADSGTMTDQEVEAAETPSETTAVLTAPTYTRDGYAFAGWTTTTTGYGKTYGPSETVTVGDLSQNGFQLYARWLKSSGTLQDFTAAQCSTMAEHEVIALTDNRDGNVYTVAKLKDHNCWMTSNLALNLADFAGTDKLTSENTDVANDNASNVALSRCSKTQDHTDDCYDENKSASEQAYYWDPLVGTDGDSTPTYYVFNSNGYYNWFASTAGSGSLSMTEKTAVDSVCPSGWKMPLKNSWSILARAESSSYQSDGADNSETVQLLKSFPVSLTSAGYHDAGASSISSASMAYYFTGYSTNTTTNAVNLNFSSTTIWTQGHNGKLREMSVRCMYRMQ